MATFLESIVSFCTSLYKKIKAWRDSAYDDTIYYRYTIKKEDLQEKKSTAKKDEDERQEDTTREDITKEQSIQKESMQRNHISKINKQNMQNNNMQEDNMRENNMEEENMEQDAPKKDTKKQDMAQENQDMAKKYDKEEKDTEKQNTTDMPYSQIIEGKQSLGLWILENSDENGLKDSLPDKESIGLVIPTLKNLAEQGLFFADGALDGLCGSGDSNGDEEAKELFDMFVDFASIPDDVLGDSLFDLWLGRIYTFLITHRTLGYIDEFLELFREHLMAHEGDDEERSEEAKRLDFFLYTIAERFLKTAPHREAIKFSLALRGVFSFTKEGKMLELFKLFGLADEFAPFVGLAFARKDMQDEVFSLIQKVKGWGRIAYVRFLDSHNEAVQKWLLLEGYKCDVGIDHIVLACLEEADIFAYIEKNGIDEKLYIAMGEMIYAFVDYGKISFKDYADSKKLVAIFVRESKKQKMNLERFATLCELIEPIREELEYSEEEKEELIDVIRHIAFQSHIDWEGLVRSNVFDYHARIIARNLNFDIWEDMFREAKRMEHFDNWYPLTLTRDTERYKRLCAFASERFDLESLKGLPRDELGIGKEFDTYSNLEMIVQNLNEFEEIIGLELVETLLQSPVVRSRNMALKAIESYKEIPSHTLEIIKANTEKEPNSGVRERYEKILEKEAQKQSGRITFTEREWHLRVWQEFGSSGIWDIGTDGARKFSNVDYESLDLPQSLRAEFEAWQKVFDKYGLSWCAKDSSALERKFEKVFEKEKLRLAKKLKAFFKHKAYIETHIDGKLREIKYYYLEGDCDSGLWDEEGCMTMIWEIEEELGVKFSEKKRSRLDGEIEKWAMEYFNVAFKDGRWVEVTDKKVLQKGKLLAQKLASMLPRYCCVEYRHEEELQKSMQKK